MPKKNTITRNEITDDELKEISIKRQILSKKKRQNELKKEKKLIEFSKKIMFFVMFSAFVVILYSMYLMRKTGDVSQLGTLITETMDFAKIGVGFYSSKAMVENVFKGRNKNKQIIENLTQNEEEVIL